jgi:hypothetical protein
MGCVCLGEKNGESVKSSDLGGIQMGRSQESSPVRKSIDYSKSGGDSPSPMLGFRRSSNQESPTYSAGEGSPRSRTLSRSSSFRTMMSDMMHGVMKKKSDHIKPICKLCQQSLKDGENVCHCLIEEMYPNNKQTNQQIREQYLQNRELIQNMTNIDQHPEKLVKFVEEVYQIIEKSSLKDDLSPASMAKAKENLVNHLCTHLEEIIVEEA